MGAEGGATPRIGLDGFNLALEQGTGIATYGRNLSYVLKDMGAAVDVYYGRNMASRSRGRSVKAAEADLLQEIGFFDSAPALSINNYIAGAAYAARSLFPLRTEEVPIRGDVVADDFRSRMPAFDRVWNSRNLFALAHNHFHAWGRFLKVTVPNPPDVMHWTYPMPIEMVGTKNIYTVHDLVPLRLPHTTLDHKRRYLRMVKMLARRADHIVTVSETSKADILRIMDIPQDRVTNTFQAVDFSARALARSEADWRSDVSGAVGLPHKGYYLFFGAIEPKKNVGRLIEGFLTANVNAPLVLVGKKAWKSEQELRLLPLAQRRRNVEGTADAPRWSVRQGLAAAGASADRKDKAEAAVMQLDYVPHSMLISLIRGAKAVVFPSIYEGFGLPVLEAMLLGTPVITSNTSSLPEVAGDAALFVDPYDPRAIGEAVRRMDEDAGLRHELSERGRKQAARFSTLAYRERLGELYGRLGVTLS